MAGRGRTPHEELANALSHGLGCVLAMAALPLLLHIAQRRGGATTGVLVFATTMILLYLASALYHAVPAGRTKVLLGKIDQAAIFLFIAGSYTPFALGALRGGLGWTLFAIVWGCALAGVLLKSFGKVMKPLPSAALYMAMGWLVLIASGPALDRVAPQGLALLLAGGLAYTIGVGFFLIDGRLRYGHLVWHLFVLTGSTCHFFAALWYSPVSL